MNIGFVTTWFERGAAYVTKAYIDALKNENRCYIYARGGEIVEKTEGKSVWASYDVHLGMRLPGTRINDNDILKWIKNKGIDVLFFNEQQEMDIVARIKAKNKRLVVGTYIDYYKESTISHFEIYDFLICNTKRHYSVFSWHENCHYIKWGTSINEFYPNNMEKGDDKVTFFHSAGMSPRKGTKILYELFVKRELYKRAKLIIHTQMSIPGIEENRKIPNVQVIKKTVGSPGLYHLGDVYVYPTTLEGLGLTIYEALACGLPVITTNEAPMNEVINDEIGKLVAVNRTCSRSDGYYWPLSFCDENSLEKAIVFYIENIAELNKQKILARRVAENEYNFQERYSEIQKIFKDAYHKGPAEEKEKLITSILDFGKREKRQYILLALPDWINKFLYKFRDKKNRSRVN